MTVIHHLRMFRFLQMQWICSFPCQWTMGKEARFIAFTLVGWDNHHCQHGGVLTLELAGILALFSPSISFFHLALKEQKWMHGLTWLHAVPECLLWELQARGAIWQTTARRGWFELQHQSGISSMLHWGVFKGSSSTCRAWFCFTCADGFHLL